MPPAVDRVDAASATRGAEDASAEAACAPIDAVSTVVGGASAAAHVAYALSDMVWVFGEGEGAGHEILSWAAAGGVNAFGDRGSARVLETRPGAGGALRVWGGRGVWALVEAGLRIQVKHS